MSSLYSEPALHADASAQPSVADRRSDSPSYDANWEKIADISSGAQAYCAKVRHRTDGRIGFLKVLREQHISERRARFFREMEILETLHIRGVPQLLESNAEHYQDTDYKLYIVSEFIEGRNLTDLVAHPEFSPQQAMQIALRLCDIVEAAHDAGVLHRDIKPDNILVADDGGELQPYVVDFGIGHVSDTPEDFTTEAGQEIGNRFLRLPEFSSGMADKRDKRSDVTFVAGVLFYMLTGIKPSVLQDGGGRHPHQRAKEKARLAETGLREDVLLDFFDKTFANDLNRRFQSIEGLRTSLRRLSQAERAKDAKPITFAQMTDRLNTTKHHQRIETQEALSRIVQEASEIAREIPKSLGSAVHWFQTNANADASKGFVQNEIGLTVTSDPSKKFSATFYARMRGAEILLTVISEDAKPMRLRVPIGNGLSEHDREAIVRYYLDGLDMLTRPELDAVTAQDVERFERQAQESATDAVQAIDEQVREYLRGLGEDAPEVVSETPVRGARKLGRVMIAQSSIVVKLHDDAGFVRFNGFARMRIPRSAAEEVWGDRQLTVTRTEGPTGSGPEDATASPDHSGEFRPTIRQISEAVAKVMRAG